MAKQHPIAVKCTNVTKRYGTEETGVWALRGVDLSIRSGELTMLVGPSGCGKTTLISIIAGILNQTGGECEVFGHAFHEMTENEKIAFRAENIGFVFQAFNLFPALTAAENVAVPLLIADVDRKEAVEKGRQLLGLMGLEKKCDSYPSGLSGGQQQRVAIARALVRNPRLIVCDEPTSALDSVTGHKIMELLKNDVLAPDRSLIVVTHDVRILEFADRTAEMDDGHIVKVVTSPHKLEH